MHQQIRGKQGMQRKRHPGKIDLGDICDAGLVTSPRPLVLFVVLAVSFESRNEPLHWLQVVITAAQGGHQAPVQALLPFGPCLVSADWAGVIKIWDMASGQCIQTIQQAHKEPIMRLLPWEVST